MPPNNRKQRRAAAAAATSASTKEETFDPSSIPLARPPAAPNARSRPAKTLLEIAAERQQELNQFVGDDGSSNDANNNKNNKKKKKNDTKDESLFDLNATKTQFLQVSPNGEISSFDPATQNQKKKGHHKQGSSEENNFEKEEGEQGEEDEEEGLPPLIDTVLLSLPLTTVHLTLAFLAAHQYMEEIVFKNLLRESAFIAFPILTSIIHLAHGHIITWPRIPSLSRRRQTAKATKKQQSIITSALIGDLYTSKTVFFLPLAILLGGLLVRTTSEAGYYAVMKRAPSIGTLWVWCVLEISSPLAALAAVLLPLAWGRVVMGYSLL